MPNTYACKGVFNPNIPIFLPNSAEGLHFSDFHYNCNELLIKTCLNYSYIWSRRKLSFAVTE